MLGTEALLLSWGFQGCVLVPMKYTRNSLQKTSYNSAGKEGFPKEVDSKVGHKDNDFNRKNR